MSGEIPAAGLTVARFALPTPVHGMDRMVDLLEDWYGPGLLMHTEGGWLVISRPPS